MRGRLRASGQEAPAFSAEARRASHPRGAQRGPPRARGAGTARDRNAAPARGSRGAPIVLRGAERPPGSPRRSRLPLPRPRREAPGPARCRCSAPPPLGLTANSHRPDCIINVNGAASVSCAGSLGLPLCDTYTGILTRESSITTGVENQPVRDSFQMPRKAERLQDCFIKVIENKNY